MYTEDEAKKRWCPFSRFAVHQEDGAKRWTAVTAINRHENLFLGTENLFLGACIGSKCMAWRAGEPPEDELIARTGYCGIAGKP